MDNWDQLEMSLKPLQSGVLITILIPDAFDVDVRYIRWCLLLVRSYHVQRIFHRDFCHFSKDRDSVPTGFGKLRYKSFG